MVVGDCRIGKTRFILRYLNQPYPVSPDVPEEEAYEPTVFNSWTSKETFEENGGTIKVDISLWDTPGSFSTSSSMLCFEIPIMMRLIESSSISTRTIGSTEYDTLRPLSYPGTDCFVVCFSLKDRESFENVRRKWIPEITQHNPNIPYVLVGLHVEKRDQWDDLSHVTYVRASLKLFISSVSFAQSNLLGS